MTTVPASQAIGDVLDSLQRANARFAIDNPGPSAARQPVHTVYGGAHLFRADSAPKLGELALRSLKDYAPDASSFAQALGLTGAALSSLVYERVVKKLQNEPVEDFRIDFEDGYGTRPDAEEDSCARAAAEEVARGMKQRTLPPYLGIRIKPFGADTLQRAVRTLDMFLTTLSASSGRQLPDHFVITLPKVVIPEQVAALSTVLESVEAKGLFPANTLRLEIMVETTQSILDGDG